MPLPLAVALYLSPSALAFAALCIRAFWLKSASSQGLVDSHHAPPFVAAASQRQHNMDHVPARDKRGNG